MRDLLAVLSIDRVTLVGHSLGGGIAAQFAYQYPHMVERLVLVSSGGVTKDVTSAANGSPADGRRGAGRAATSGRVPAIKLAGRAAQTVFGSTKHGRDLSDGLGLLGRLAHPAALSAFSRTCGQWWTGEDSLSPCSIGAI